MTARTAGRLAWSVWAAMVAALLSGVLLVALNGLIDQEEISAVVVVAVVALAYGTVGALIASRRPENPIGWIFQGASLMAMVGFVAGEYAVRGLVSAPGSLPGASAAAWLQSWIGTASLGAIPFMFLLFPTGRLPSRRWRPVAFLAFAGWIFIALGTLLRPGGYERTISGVAVPGTNATGIEIARAADWQWFVFMAWMFVIVICVFAPILRWRRATGPERQQLKWFGRLAATMLIAGAVAILLSTPLFSSVPFLPWIGVGIGVMAVFACLIVGIPIAFAISILRHQLLGIEVVIKRTVMFGLLAAFVTAIYVAIVVGIGAAVGSRGESGVILPAVAAAVVAVAFQPIRLRAQRLANRLVYGERASPYEVLSEFSDRLGGTYSTDDVLPRMAQILAGGTGALRTEVWLRVGSRLRLAAAVPAADAADLELSVVEDELPEIPNVDLALPVRHGPELLGALAVAMPQAEPLNDSQERLIQDLSAQAGLVLRNARLIEELRASRQRLVAAQDEERRRLERNIHDGAQQQLVALAIKQRLSKALVRKDPQRAETMLGEVEQETSEALENLRDLARGIYPPLLADKGLAAALEGQARKAPLPVEVSEDGAGRYDQEIEAAVYFSCLEALQNVAKYANATRAEIRLSQANGHLTFEVKDDGAGFDASATSYGTGLQGIADRLDAIGGSFDVRSEPGRGTTVMGSVRVQKEPEG